MQRATNLLAALLLAVATTTTTTFPATHAFVLRHCNVQPRHRTHTHTFNPPTTTTTTTIMQASPFSTSTSKSIMSSSPEFAELQKVTVQSAATGKSIKLGETFPGSGNKKTIVAFFTHFGDFNSFEYAEKLLYYLPEIEKAGVNLVCVGIGNVEAAREFARLVGGFPLDKLYADETAAGYKEFGFSRGFAADVPVNPYLKLLPMLAGIGSPGTLQAVLRGYVGDRKADASWTSRYLNKNKNKNVEGGENKALVDKSAFDVLGTEGARPFEVATVRLQNMMAILPMWEKLSPADKNLITQQGGSVVFEGRKVLKVYKDKGILTYTDIDDLLQTVGVKN